MSSRASALIARLTGASRRATETWRTWASTDRYICEQLGLNDPIATAALETIESSELPPIGVTANQGKLLELFGRLVGAKRILELGTLGGYSTIWLARSLPPDGRLVTIEANPAFAEVAAKNIAAAGFSETVELRVAPALDVLPDLAQQPPFDLIFIDADKDNYPAYIEWALRLSRPGTLIVADNVIGEGAIVNEAASTDRDPWGGVGGVPAVRKVYEMLGQEPRLQTTAIQTVGEKGYDGFALALVTEAPTAP
jgi:predicted O-methyltransferase YrrM